MPWPNLWILGPPKCGTSSLFRWLADHPQVAAASEKEPFYLVDPESPFRRPEANFTDHGFAGYDRYLPEPCPQPFRLDGTTHTLFQRTAVEVLADLDPAPWAVAVLRKPSERIYSSFQFTRHVLAALDPTLGFAEFCELRERGDTATLERRSRRPRSLWVLLRDLEYSDYHRWLEPWHRGLGDRLRLLVFERLSAEPKTVTTLASELGLDPTFYDDYDFPRLNRTFRARSPWLHRWARALRPRVPRHPATLALYRFYLRFQKRRRAPEPRPAEDLEWLARLDQRFLEANQRLAETFDLDLDPWR